MTVQDISHLLAEGPAQLLARSLADYAVLLRSAAELAPEHLEAVDYALRNQVVRLLVRAADEQELEPAYDALRRMVPIEREAELARWETRWRAFADLLDARLAALVSAQPEAARRFAHAAEILALVGEEPGLTQAEVGERLGLKPANLSRVLGVLEAHELIERRRVGRNKEIQPGRLLPRSASPERREPQVSEAPAAEGWDFDLDRGRSYLLVGPRANFAVPAS